MESRRCLARGRGDAKRVKEGGSPAQIPRHCGLRRSIQGVINLPDVLPQDRRTKRHGEPLDMEPGNLAETILLHPATVCTALAIQWNVLLRPGRAGRAVWKGRSYTVGGAAKPRQEPG